MAYQNINQYVYNKWYLQPLPQVEDLSLSNDEREYNEEVVFSPLIIGSNNGNVLPVKMDLNSSGTSEQYILEYGEYVPENILISENYYNDLQLDLSCFSSKTICDIGLTGIDNGLVNKMTGETLYYTEGIFEDSVKFDRMHYDRRFKMIQVTGYTGTYNRFSGITKQTI